MTYRVLVTPISDRVLPPLFWSGPFARKSDAVANVLSGVRWADVPHEWSQ